MQPLYVKIFLIVIPIIVYTQLISPLVSGGGTVFVPENNIKNSKALITQYEAAVVQADKLANDVKTITGDLESFDPAVEQVLEVVIPASVDPVMFTDELTEFIKAGNLPVTDFSQSLNTRSTYPELGEYNVSFTVQGDYEEFKRVLRFIESSLRLYDIQSVEFSISDKPGQLSGMKVQAKTYFLK